jgi:hypothetical protein
MTSDDAPGVALATVVGAGLLWNLLGPNALGGIVVVAGGLVAACVWAAAVAVGVVGVPAWWWGPVRVTTARMRWALSGPADRGPALRVALAGTSGVAVSTGAVIGLLVGALARSSAGVGLSGVGLCTVGGAVAAIVVVAGAGIAQMRRAARMTGSRVDHRIGLWHRRAVSPADGLAAAGRLLLVTADTEFVEHARRVRWCATHSRSPSRSVRRPTAVRAMLRADVLRLGRRPGDVVAWIAIVALAIALGLTTTMSVGAPALMAVLAYRAGGAVASGLRAVTTTPALRRALGASPTQMLVAHSVIPATAVLTWAVVAVMTVGGVSSLGWGVIVLGAIVATLRRASRPELPWDAPVYITGQGGVAQPLLVLALLRGHIAITVVAALACVV